MIRADLCANSSCCQAWASLDTLQDKLGDAFSQYWQKAAQAVEETDGMVLTYDGQLIDAVYFSCSGGATEDAVGGLGRGCGVPTVGGEPPARRSLRSLRRR